MDYGLIVDLETTGLDYSRDKIIEIGLLQFAIRKNEPPVVQEMYSALEDPEEPLKEEITKITGLTDPYLKGRKIDWLKVQHLFENSSIAIAHNAKFDSQFLKKQEFYNNIDIHWACSMEHIDWQEKGFKTRSLNYLAADHGFLNPFAHRALFDCALTFRVVTPYIQELIQNSYEKQFLIQAFEAPFEAKDLLKQRKYQWNPGEKVWQKFVIQGNLDQERQFLEAKIYRGTAIHSETEVSLNT